MASTFYAMPGVFGTDHQLMEFLPFTDPTDRMGDPWSDGISKVGDLHAWDLRDENLPADHRFKAVQNKRHRLVEGDPKTGHPLVGNRDL